MSGSAALRAVIFTDVNGPVSATLVRETVSYARASGRLDVVALVVSDRAAFRLGRGRKILRSGRRLAAALLDDGVPLAGIREATLDLDAVERRLKIPVLVPEDGNVNDPRFVRRLELALRPDVALSFYCLRIFRRPLLDAFEQCVNYHDSLLPRHRGLLATSFSVYAGDSETGFTFHRMDESVDGGRIVVQGSVPVGDDSIAAIKRRKLAAAVTALPRALRMIVAGSSGVRQVGPGEYHSRREAMALLHVDVPEEVRSEELHRRLRAFGVIRMNLGGLELPITRLRPSRADRAHAFRAADGAWLEPDRVIGLPTSLYRLARALERRSPSDLLGSPSTTPEIVAD